MRKSLGFMDQYNLLDSFSTRHTTGLNGPFFFFNGLNVPLIKLFFLLQCCCLLVSPLNAAPVSEL